jgi:phosphoglycerate dehydrogenase-like enzyme
VSDLKELTDLNVVVFHHVEDEFVAAIAAVSPRVHVRVGAKASQLDKARQHNVLYPPADVNDLLSDADVLFTFTLPDDLIARAPRLKWVQLSSAGVDQVAGLGLESSDITVTTTSGIHAGPMSEFVLGAMLMFAHRFPRALRQQSAHVWKRYATGELAGKTVGVVGYGHIGKAIARLALSLDMQVYATQRSVAVAREETTGRGIVHLLPPSDLQQLLERSDFVVLAVPLVQDTTHLIGARELAAMKPTAHLVNISRGSVVDESALTRALQDGRIAGAALDVFETEPLPPDSPLRGLDNVYLSPHAAGASEDYLAMAPLVAAENVIRVLTGEEPHTILNPEVWPRRRR